MKKGEMGNMLIHIKYQNMIHVHWIILFSKDALNWIQVTVWNTEFPQKY